MSLGKNLTSFFPSNAESIEMNEVILLTFLVSLSSWCGRMAGVWGLLILSGGPPAFANNSSVSGLVFFSTKHFVISEHVLFHFVPKVSKIFQRDGIRQ